MLTPVSVEGTLPLLPWQFAPRFGSRQQHSTPALWHAPPVMGRDSRHGRVTCMFVLVGVVTVLVLGATVRHRHVPAHHEAKLVLQTDNDPRSHTPSNHSQAAQLHSLVPAVPGSHAPPPGAATPHASPYSADVPTLMDLGAEFEHLPAVPQPVPRKHMTPQQKYEADILEGFRGRHTRIRDVPQGMLTGRALVRMIATGTPVAVLPNYTSAKKTSFELLLDAALPFHTHGTVGAAPQMRVYFKIGDPGHHEFALHESLA